MKIYEVIPQNEKLENEKIKNGTITRIEKDGLICKCKDGYLKITDIAMEGKKRCKVHDFLNGINGKELIGKVLK